ncbi:fructose-6-phosphate aldolase [Desulfonatronovibrio magnus]|uniref:fructose-6-phosphate aldolase n=1 Tax=Desulfonatronovibrio magnus TaxID=698827 RepID=UPI0005EBDB98|nr:fructose-6-phosphate aldolase [Desulfonatronovibrio magnus]RQD57663.1 MAG: fructose-6-phosphate aldolase [Desulfonatronovibrio sp. MSAO_Bac4]
MKFFIDTANIQEIKQAIQYGMVDGVTTNPSLMAKEGKDWKEVAAEICELVPGPVSLEVIATETKEMISEARDLVKFGPNVVVKIPMTMPGIEAVKALSGMDIETNVTLVFSPLQALLAAKAGAAYVSPFVGRLDDIGQNGMDVVSDIISIYDNYAFDTEIIVASIRHPGHVMESALMGADIATIPFKVIEKLSRHPLTDIGLEAFLKDWSTRK